MGNRAGPISEFDQKVKWEQLGIEFGAQILRNTETGQQVQKYRVDAVDIHKLQIQLMVYNLRMHQFPNCVRILYYSFQKSESICGNADCFIVVTERTQRFIHMGPLTLLEARYMLRECLIGFNSLFEVFGLFDIEPTFIAINDQGKVKVWLNDIYGLNTVDEEPCPSHTQSRQIKRLISIIERKILPEELPVDFGNEVIRAETLLQAIEILNTAEEQVIQAKFATRTPMPMTPADMTTITGQNLRSESVEQDKKTLQVYYKTLRRAQPKVQLTYQSPTVEVQQMQQPIPVIKNNVIPQQIAVQPTPIISQPVQVLWNSSALALTLDPHQSLKRVANQNLVHFPHQYAMIQEQQSRISSLSQSSHRLIHPHIPQKLHQIPVVDSMIVIQKGTDSRVDWARASIEESRVVSHM